MFYYKLVFVFFSIIQIQVSDSIVFNDTDSIMRSYQDTILFADSLDISINNDINNQLTTDTIFVQIDSNSEYDKGSENWSKIIDIIMSVLTLLALILAIWGEQIRARFNKLNLIINDKNLTGELTKGGENSVGQRDDLILFHLLLRNKTSGIIAKNVRVILVAYSKVKRDGEIEKKLLAGEASFLWTPMEQMNQWIDIADEQTFDFLVLSKQRKVIHPTLSIYFNNFGGAIGINETLRLELKVKADNFKSSKNYFYEISWRGEWSESMETNRSNISIRRVTSLE